jgi:hypothetical protein
VRVVFTPTGQVLGRSDYLPFGETLNPIGALPRQRFTGQERDGDVGMDYLNARNLQLRTGRMNAPAPVFAGARLNPASVEPLQLGPEQRAIALLNSKDVRNLQKK